MAEAGLPNYVTGNWYGVLAPAGTPRDLVVRLNREMNAILKQPEINERLIKQGYEPASTSPEDFGRFIKSEITDYAALVKAAGIRAD